MVKFIAGVYQRPGSERVTGFITVDVGGGETLSDDEVKARAVKSIQRERIAADRIYALNCVDLGNYTIVRT